MVDIITCVRNGEKYLNQCIESVLNQTYEDFTYYIVDNASSDNSKKIIEDYQEKDDRIIYLYQPIKGLSRSLNLAISASKNEYMCFLDADDLYHPKKINKQIEFLYEKEDYEICFTHLQEFSDNEEESLILKPRREVLDGISKCSILFKRSIIKQIGLFDEKVEIDFVEWFSRVIRKEIQYAVIPEVLCFRRVHDMNMTKNIDKSKYLEVLKMHLHARANQK